MDRSVAAVGATSGTLSALLIRLAADFLSSDQVGLDCPICPEAWAGFGQFEQFDPASLLLGIIVGLCVGPLLDLCYLARSSWRVWIRTRLAQLHRQSSGELYKII